MNFEEFLGKTISVLVTGKDGKKEAYTGIMSGYKPPFIYLEFFEAAQTLEGIWIREDVIESIWVYKTSQEVRS